MAFASFCLNFVTFILDTPIRIKRMIAEKHDIMKRWELHFLEHGYWNSATQKGRRGDASENWWLMSIYFLISCFLNHFVLNRIFSIFVSVSFSLKVSAPANFAHFRWYTDIQCKSIIHMLENNIVLWSVRNKTSEKIVRLHHSKGVILITPWGWHGKRRIQISQKPQQFVGKMKCNTNRDVKSNNPVFDQDTAPRNTPSRG